MPRRAGGAAVRLLCALLFALWALPSAVPGDTGRAASLTPRIAREAPAVVSKRQTVATAELKSWRARKDGAPAPDGIEPANEPSMLDALPRGLCRVDRQGSPCWAAPQTGKLARAPPPVPFAA